MGNDWRSSAFKRIQVATIAGLGYPLISALGHTLRWTVEGLQHLDAIHSSGRQPVMAFWHGRILPATYYFRNRGIVVITSENFDGEWIARHHRALRIWHGSRGSSSRGGAEVRFCSWCARSVGRASPRDSRWTVLAVPARVSQPGAVWLAKASGHPVSCRFISRPRSPLDVRTAGTVPRFRKPWSAR